MTSPERPLVLVGFRDEAAGPLREAADSVGVPVAAIARCEDLATVLSDVAPVGIVLRHEAPGAAEACTQARTQLRLALVPIFSVASQANDLAFAELFAWGGDDLVAGVSVQPLVRRLRAVLADIPGASSKSGLHRISPRTAGLAAQRVAAPARHAVVAGADPAWRTVMGRALYGGGFAVRFASTGESLREECAREDVRVVVAVDDLPPDGAAAVLASAREQGSTAAWVLVAPPKRMAAAHAAVKAAQQAAGAAGQAPPAAVADGYAPPENVTFIVNELIATRGIDKRASPRLLYGTAVAFRVAGREEDEVGYSYNVSAGGLYVRTTAPPEAGQEVWLEMWPPRVERRVRLAGRVAWRRALGPVGGATAPPGFGVQITDGLAGDFDRWRAGHATFMETILGPRPS